MELTDKQKKLVQKVGIALERDGLQPAAARIIGLLYISDKPELTFEEIMETLQISKSATSNALNLLLHTGRLEYITFSGDRKRYFRILVSDWREGFAKKLEDMTSFSLLLKEVLKERTSETTEFNKKLEELADFMTYVNNELPGMLEKWEQGRK